MEQKVVRSKIKKPQSKYSESFKKAVVKEFEQGLLNKDQLQRKYGLPGNSIVLNWCKLHYLLHCQQCFIGRDALFGLLRAEGLLVKKKRRFHKTTNSRHWLRKYPNLVQQLQVSRPEQLWVADITYLSLQQGHCYLHLVSDAYPKQIIGYQVSANMEALKIALAQRSSKESLIHHSDRGLQYYSAAYTELLHKHQIQISMTQDGSPYDNAIAERRILKKETHGQYRINQLNLVMACLLKRLAVNNKKQLNYQLPQ